MAPKKVRGKISRALAAKLAIAVKADAFSHNFIAEKLKDQFEAQVKRVMAKAGPAEASRPDRNFQQRRN